MRAKLDKLTGNLRESDLPSGVDLPAMQQQAHRHDNKSVLDKFSESDGKLLFDGAAVGGGDSVATQTENGLMSAADKVKLDGLGGAATQTENGLMSAADKTKLDKFAEQDGELTFNGQPVGGGTVDSAAWEDVTGKPSTFPPETHQHAISDVTGLQDALGSVATQTENGLMSAADKVKLDGLGGVATQTANGLMSKEDKTKLDGLGGVATQTANGLMSKEDKTKLDGLVQAQIGSIALFSGSSIPTGYLLCDGSALSREVYAELFSAIGTTWGAGDGENTFNIPDLRGKFIRGCGGNAAPLGTEQSEGLPDATGWFKVRYGTVSEVDYAAFSLMQAETTTSTTYPGQQPSAKMSFSLSGANPIYGSSNHVTPLNNSVNFIIKY